MALGWGWRGEDATRGPGDRAVRDACTPVSLGPWRDCLQALEDGHDTSSIYLVKPENTNRLMQVWCDQRHDPGGWTVIQRRLDGSVNFFRNWETYKVRTPTYTERQGPRREACVAPREVDPDRASRWGGPAAPPLPHQLSHVRTRHALPSFPNAFLSRSAPSKKQLYVFFKT